MPDINPTLGSHQRFLLLTRPVFRDAFFAISMPNSFTPFRPRRKVAPARTP